MMNVVALCLVINSIVVAGIMSPPPPIQINLVEIEYDQDGGSSKVQVSPQDKELYADSSSLSSQKRKVDEEIGHHKGRKLKQVLLEKAREAKDKAGEAEGEAKHTVGETLEKVADKAVEAAEKVKEGAKDAAHSATEKLKGVSKEAIATGYTLQKDVRQNSTEYLLPLLPDSFIWACASMKLLGLSLAYGTAVWVTLLSTYITADTLSRQQFAVLQSKMYPAYFKVVAFSIGMALLSHCLTSEKGLSSIQALNLSASLLVVLFNLNYMEPRANKLMFDAMKLEKEEGRRMERPTDEPSVVRNIDSLVAPLAGKSRSVQASVTPSENPEGMAYSSSASRLEMAKMSGSLKKLNFYSSKLNILVLVSLTFHLVYLGQMVHT